MGDRTASTVTSRRGGVRAWRRRLEELEEDLQTSIRTRQAEQRRLGEDGPHRRRINDELRLLRQVQKKVSGS